MLKSFLPLLFILLLLCSENGSVNPGDDNYDCDFPREKLNQKFIGTWLYDNDYLLTSGDLPETLFIYDDSLYSTGNPDFGIGMNFFVESDAENSDAIIQKVPYDVSFTSFFCVREEFEFISPDTMFHHEYWAGEDTLIGPYVKIKD